MTGPAMYAGGVASTTIDYAKLKEALASPQAASMLPEIRARMQADILKHEQEQMAVRPDVSQVSNPAVQAQRHQIGVETAQNESLGGSIMGVGMQAIFQVGHDLSFGILPSAYGKDPSVMTGLQRGMEIPVKLASGLGTMIIQGAGLMRGLSYVGRAPIVARALEFIPGRMKEIGLGALINGGIDAMRADGLEHQADGSINNPTWLDPSAKIAKPLAELGIPDRVALAMGGAVVGGIVGPVLMGIGAGITAGRTAKFASALTPESAEAIKAAILRAGIDPGTTATKYDLAKVFITNFRKIQQNEASAGVMADMLSKEQYIAGEMAEGLNAGSANIAQPSTIAPLTEEQGRLTANIFRNNPGGVNVVTGLTDDGAVQVAQERLGIKLITAKVERTPEMPKPLPEGVPSVIGPGNADNINLTYPKNDSEMVVELLEGKIDGRYRIHTVGPDGKSMFRDFPEKYTREDALNEVAYLKERFLKRAPKKTIVDRGVQPLLTTDAGAPIEGSFLPEPATFDLLVSRPNYEYPSFSDKTSFGRLTAKITDVMKTMATKAATSVTVGRTTEAFILADGTPIRGGLNLSSMIEKMKLQQPVVGGVNRGDLALKEAGKFVRLNLEDAGKLSIELPRSLSSEQFRALGQAIDTMKFTEVSVETFDGMKKVFQTPIGAVVQDHIVDMVKPKSISSSITPEMVDQYKRTGVFNGQAAVLPDGSVAKVINKAGAVGYKVEEQLTGKQFIVHHKNLTILPTALQGELQPSNFFTSYLSDAERSSLAKLRTSIAAGWAEPIKKYRDFESFANTRGYMSNSLRGGKVELMKVNEGTGNPIKFQSLAAAVEWIRKDSGPMAELAADDISKILGPDRNIGFIGGGGPPPRFNEMMPIPWERMQRTMESLKGASPGFFEGKLKPMMPYLRDLDTRFGTSMYPAAANMQTQGVARDNFIALWYHGKDGHLPAGVRPLGEIEKMAGKNADAEIIGHWLEAPDDFARVEIESRMSRPELASAKELRKWYDAAYPALGIEAPFVENYMPRYREFLQQGNAGTFADFMASIAGDELKVPKGTDFVSDHIRQGTIDAYEPNAFAVAQQYLRSGAKNRFLKTAQDEARKVVRMIADKNPNLALPLANMLQAMGGYEFAEQRAMLNETFRSLLGKFPGKGDRISLAEKLTDWSTSLVYASTMGFRPSLALRNAKDIFVMAYPLYSGPRFMEAVGRALTQGGKEEAMAARAISSYGGAMLNMNELETLEKLPEWLKKVQHASTALYDSADDFTRAGTFFAAKYKTEEALSVFAKKVDRGLSGKGLESAISDLVRESRMYMHGKDVETEFLRLAGNSPDQAATYAGKIASDMTNFLYGRGMQARWMRSIGGRLMGQFGSWSMWYADYLMRMTRGVLQGPYRADALAALGKHALINAALLATGKEVLNIDLSRWGSYGALFYSGGPGTQVAMGVATLQRGLGDASSAGEDPLSQSRISAGSQMIWNTLPAFVPFYSAGRDVLRMTAAANDWSKDPSQANATDFLAATLGTRTTKDFQARRKVDILLGDFQNQPFSSTSPALGLQLNNQAIGRGVQPVDLRSPGLVVTPGVSNPIEAAPAAAQTTRMEVRLKNRGQVPAYKGPGEVKANSTIEPKPSGGY